MTDKEKMDIEKFKAKEKSDEEKCEYGIYNTVDVVVIRLREVLRCKIDEKAKLLLEDIIDNNWSHHKEDKIIKLLDDIDASCQEGWDDDQRGNFYTIMNITEEIKKELT